MRAEAGMARERTAGLVGVAAALVAPAACGARGPKPPAREEVLALLQQEANQLKAGGEKLDPVLGVKATWTVAGIDVTERPTDPDRPWAGKIRFKIRSETRDIERGVIVDESDKDFDYVYSATLGKWIFQLAPAPAPQG
jgi:hypothetical protein